LGRDEKESKYDAEKPPIIMAAANANHLSC
jgi:hypothetical protein